MAEYIADFSGVSDATVHMMHPSLIHEEVWQALRLIDLRYLQSMLPGDQLDRANILTHQFEHDGLQRYIAARADPGSVPELDKSQKFSGPLSAVIWKGIEPVGVINTADTVSARSGTRAELTAKGWFPWWRYANLRDFAIHPDLVQSKSASNGAKLVSGLVLGALYHSLEARSPSQRMSAYVHELPRREGVDPADAGMYALVHVLGMKPDRETQPMIALPGRPNVVFQRRMVLGVDTTRRRIMDLPEADLAIRGMTVLIPKP